MSATPTTGGSLWEITVNRALPTASPAPTQTPAQPVLPPSIEQAPHALLALHPASCKRCTCDRCDASCKTCSGANHCTSCPTGTYLYSNSSCGACLDAGWFADGSQCSACNASCLACKDKSTSVLHASPGMTLVNDTCVKWPRFLQERSLFSLPTSTLLSYGNFNLLRSRLNL
jgi:hypothetical protein